MTDQVWSARDTTPDAIDSALRDLLRQRHGEDSSLAPARVLNLVVVVDRDWKGEIANRLDRVGRYHASRTILCAVEPGRKTLDATAVMSYDRREGGFGVMRETVEIDLGEMHLGRLDSVIDPVVKEDLPLMLWCPHGHQDAVDSVRSMIDVMLLDSDELDEPDAALARAQDLGQTAYVVDLAWLRTTPWRERIASSFDVPDRLKRLRDVEGLTIRFRRDSMASAALLAGWMSSRLGWELSHLGDGDGWKQATAQRARGETKIVMKITDQQSPGLAGVTVSTAGRFSLSLDRAEGGLQAREHLAGKDRTWQVLGASRGEGGILGEGVRQALLRDPTYGPSLAAARSFWN